MKKQTVTKVLAENDRYTIELAGKADETNCGYPVCGYHYPKPELQAQPNISVRIENTGQTDIVNPRLVVNNRRRYYDLSTVAAGVVDPEDRLAEKSKTFFWWYIHQRVHANNQSPENSQALIAFNTLGYMLCGNNVHVMYQLWREACMPEKQGYYKLGAEPTDGDWRGTDLGAHFTAEYYYGGRWRMLDGNVAVYYLLRDNQTIANREQLHRDHDLVRRAHYGTLTNVVTPLSREKITGLYRRELLGLYPPMEDVIKKWDFTLRPGESIEYRWDHRGLYDRGDEISKTIRDLVTGNGYWRYRPDLSASAAREGIANATNLQWPDKTGEGLSAKAPDRPFKVAWTFHCPYYFLGGRVRVRTSGPEQAKLTVQARFQRIHKGWQDVDTTQGPGSWELPLDRFFVEGLHCHDIELRLIGEGDVRVTGFELEADIQLAKRSLPMLTVGQNVVEYFDETPGDKQVRITHEFSPIDRGRAPEAPARPTSPPDQGRSDGLTFAFEWPQAKPGGGEEIIDYHFQLSDDKRFRWRLSSNFDRLTSLAGPEGVLNAYQIPHDGLLNPDQRYYWRLRAMNDKGMWSDWSPTWSFVARGPGVVRDLTAEVDEDSGDLVLHWSDAEAGTRPVAYEIHGSDERGFTASHEPVRRLKRWAIHHNLESGEPRKVEDPVWTTFPPTFQAQTTEREFRLPAGEKWYAFWRVVPVDRDGHRGGPSDFVSPPRPYLDIPAEIGVDGAEIDLPLPYVRSNGHLIHKQTPNTNLYVIGEGDQLSFRKVRGPAWLKVDEATGRLTGTTPGPGRYEFEIEVRRQDKKTHRRTCVLVVRS